MPPGTLNRFTIVGYDAGRSIRLRMLRAPDVVARLRRAGKYNESQLFAPARNLNGNLS